MSEEEKETLMASATNELRDIERTLLKHIAMELRDEEPHQFVNAFTSGKERNEDIDVNNCTFYCLMFGDNLTHGENILTARIACNLIFNE